MTARALHLQRGERLPARRLTPAEDLARALARFLESSTPPDPWSKYPPVLQVRHVSEILGLSEDAVRARARHTGAGSIPMRKRGGVYFVDQVEFRRWVSYREAASAESES